MDSSPIQQIKDRLNIVDVVSGYLKLEKTGINFRAQCPFHSEKKPSFFVSPTRQSFKCFGCGKSGSIFDFVMEIEGVEFGDALRILAKRAGVELKSYHPELKTKRQRLYEICEIGCRFFEKQLQGSTQGKRAKEYLLKRGLKEETIKQWRLGYSPDPTTGGWRALSDFLVSKGYKREEIVGAGLAVSPEQGQTPYDRFRGRIMFPVFDLHSQVIGFGGRVLEGEKGAEKVIAKYLNIPNTLLYDKSKVLYGLNFAKMDIRKNNFCILTEGYTDVILSHQAGFTNTVASSGTALTSFQLQVLKRYTSNLLTAFDMDFAGGVATKRGIDLAQENDFAIKVISMPPDSDPADIILKNPKEWAGAIKGAREIMAFYFDNALSRFDRETPEGKKEIAAALLPAIKKIPNKILQSHFVQKLANVLRVSETAVVEELKKVILQQEPTPKQQAPSQPENKKAKARQQLLEEKILSLVLRYPDHLGLIDKDIIDGFSERVRIVFTSCQKARVPEKSSLDEVIPKLKKKREELKELLDTCLLQAEIAPEQDPASEIKLCLHQLKILQVKNRLQEIAKEIQIAEEQSDQKKLKDLMQAFNQLAKTNK